MSYLKAIYKKKLIYVHGLYRTNTFTYYLLQSLIQIGMGSNVKVF